MVQKTFQDSTVMRKVKRKGDSVYDFHGSDSPSKTNKTTPPSTARQRKEKTESVVSIDVEQDANDEKNGDLDVTASEPSRPRRQLRSKIPDGYIPVPHRHELKGGRAFGPNSELWLVQVPKGFDVTVLDGAVQKEVLTTNGSQKIKVKEQGHKRFFNVQTFRDSEACKKLNTLVTDHGKNEICLGRSLQHMMVITETIKLPHKKAGFDVSRVPEKRVPAPEGLKVRFKPFGSEQSRMCLGVKPQQKKIKKDMSCEEETVSPKKKKHKLDEVVSKIKEEFVSPNTEANYTPKSSSKKYKQQHTETVPEVKSEVMQNHLNHDSIAEMATPHHKHKKSKKRKIEADLNSEELESQESSSSPHKKRKRKSMEEAEDRSAVDSLFVVDRKRINQNLSGVAVSSGSQDVPSSLHKKRKSEKERKRTVI